MANIHQMLSMNGGSFKKAEQMALGMIAKGQTDVWLDLALLMHAQGNAEGSKQAQAEYAKHSPDCPRLRFGQTWFKLYDGDLEAGLKHIEAGRVVGCLGERDFSKFEYPRWQGNTELAGKTVLLYGEGGHGDQIMGLRSARWLKELGAREVIVACSKPLMGLFAAQRKYGVVDMEHAFACKADYWLPMMSSYRLCKRTWETLWTGPYIEKPGSDIWEAIIHSKRLSLPHCLNVGIRWRGNPEFEHEQLRCFPPELMFKVTELKDATFWSLQKDERQAELPERVFDLEPLLGNWEQTAAAIGQLDLVITSCTSIAHLAAAMGKPTWVVVPAMPYYPWAQPGRTSRWYPSVTLFRQACYGQWIEPFQEVYECLERELRTASRGGEPFMKELGFDEFFREYRAKPFLNQWFVEGRELSVLEALIRRYDVKSVLEIGVNKGETAKRLLDANNGIERYMGIEITEAAIDTMNPHQRAERVRAGKDVGVEARKDRRFKTFISTGGSRDFQSVAKYDLVFIDGNHAYEYAKFDSELARKLDAKVIVWHDYGTEPGVTKAVDEEKDVIRVLRTKVAYWIRGS